MFGRQAVCFDSDAERLLNRLAEAIDNHTLALRDLITVGVKCMTTAKEAADAISAAVDAATTEFAAALAKIHDLAKSVDTLTAELQAARAANDPVAQQALIDELAAATTKLSAATAAAVAETNPAPAATAPAA